MRDAISLMHSTDAGLPAGHGSSFFHFLRSSDNPHMSLVNQMTAGGKDPQGDCAPSAVLSRLLDDGRRYPMQVLEAFCGTANGITTWEGLMACLRRFGYTCHYVVAAMPPRWLMNSAFGGLISPAQAGPYITAFTGQSVIIDSPGAWETTPPPPAPPAPVQEEDMLIVNTPSAGVYLLSGSMYVHIDDGPVLSSLLQPPAIKQWTIDALMHTLLVNASSNRGA
jgi:hypothetical protein